MTERTNPILETIAAAGGTSYELPKGIISAYSHITEPPHCYTSRIDPKYRDRAPRLANDAEGGDGFLVEGYPKVLAMGAVAAAGSPDAYLDRLEDQGLHPGVGHGPLRLWGLKFVLDGGVEALPIRVAQLRNPDILLRKECPDMLQPHAAGADNAHMDALVGPLRVSVSCRCQCRRADAGLHEKIAPIRVVHRCSLRR